MSGHKETIRVTERKRVTVERFFLTHAWHRKGILEADGYLDGNGYASNYGLSSRDPGTNSFHGKLGYSVFRDRNDAVEAVKKKAATKARELRRRLVVLDRVAANGPDDTTLVVDGAGA